MNLDQFLGVWIVKLSWLTPNFLVGGQNSPDFPNNFRSKTDYCRYEDLPVPAIEPDFGSYKWQCKKSISSKSTNKNFVHYTSKCNLICQNYIDHDWAYKGVVPAWIDCISVKDALGEHIYWEWRWVVDQQIYAPKLDCRTEINYSTLQNSSFSEAEINLGNLNLAADLTTTASTIPINEPAVVPPWSLFRSDNYEPLIETQIQAPHMRQMIANSVVKVKPHDPQKDLITPLAADRPDKLYSYSLAQREDVFLDSDQMVYIYSESAIDQIQQIRNDSINLLAKKKKCQILDIPPIKHIADPLFYCKKNWCSVYCIDNERIFRKFKGLFVCVGDNQWQLRKGWTQEKLDTKVTCTKPSCNYDDLPVYENTRWYCDVNNNECSLFCDNQAIVSIKARCKLKTLTWMIEGGPVRCVHKGWCDERVLPEIERGSWTVSKGNKAANLVCQDHDNPYKAAAKCNKKTSQWEYVENLKCNQVCQTSDLAEIEDGWWEISNKKGVTADFHCREGAVKKAARCDGDTGKWIYKGAEKAAAVESSKKKKVSIINGVPSNLRCYKYCDQNDLVSQGVGQWILHQSAGKLSGKLYCDGEITKNAAVCDTNIGQWNYKPDLSCCSVTAQLAVKDGIWERYAYNRYRLFCNGVAQDLIYICEGGMWVAYPEINWGSIFSYCSTEAANARSSTYTELRSERELRQIDF